MAVTEVQGFETAGEYTVRLEYSTDMDSMLALAEVSTHCFQYISWECKAATIWSITTPGLAMVFWENRQGERQYYFGGAQRGSDMCACGEEGTCAHADARCNCDANDNVMRRDEGYLTDARDIPITAFFAGDTGAKSPYYSTTQLFHTPQVFGKKNEDIPVV